MGRWLNEDDRQALSDVVEIALTGLSVVFLGLLLVEYGTPLSPARWRWVELAGWLIWAIFTLDFFVRLAIADSKPDYLRRNWMAALAVVLPAFRVFRIFRAVRAVRSLRLARLVTGTNRGRKALGRLAGFGGAGYVAALTVAIWLLTAAGISYLERGQPGATVNSFSDALWWAATTLIQQGSERHPITAEGRVLAVLVMVYSLAISGYITAALATFLLGRRQDAAAEGGELLRAEIRALHEEVRRLRELTPPSATDPGQRSQSATD